MVTADPKPSAGRRRRFATLIAMPRPAPVRVASLVLVLITAACQEKVEMVTPALKTNPMDEGSAGSSGSDSATDGPTGGVVTSTQAEDSGDANGAVTGDPSGDPGASSDPSAPTTGEPVPCDTPEGCTGVGGGDLAPFLLPFFRGKVCVSDAVQPGDKLALWVSTCVHPCLSVTAWSFKYVYRCTAMNCELGLEFYHPDTTGTACPADVFGEFPAAACEFTGPHLINTGGIKVGATPFTGAGSLLVPFFTNADIAAIVGDMEDADAVWTRIESHEQADERRFPLTFSPDNMPAPASCGEGVPGCTCRDIGL